MYRGFSLTTTLNAFNKMHPRCSSIGNELATQQSKDIKPLLDKITEKGVIDGTRLSDTWFASISSDVFISYSHNDKELALTFSGWLKATFDLDVFFDESIWGSADRLLKTIDNEYSRSENGNYDYGKRNFSTSHVHAMLSTAIMRVMDMSETVIFLNTNKSVSKADHTEKEEYTLSPWLYTEITIASLLRKTDWSVYRKRTVLEHSEFSAGERRLKVQYKIPTDSLALISTQTLSDWQKAYSNRTDAYGGSLDKNGGHPLNYLYDVVSE